LINKSVLQGKLGLLAYAGFASLVKEFYGVTIQIKLKLAILSY